MKKLILHITDEKIIDTLEKRAASEGKSVDEEASILLKEYISKEDETVKILAFRPQPRWKKKFKPVKIADTVTTDQIINDERYSE
jgi:plasmid stability protein